MKEKSFIFSAIFIAMFFALFITTCDNAFLPDADEKKPDVVPSTPSSVDAYSHLEPTMEKNPNRAVAQVGMNSVVSLPEDLRSEVAAVFTIHPDDTSVAKIVSQNATSCTVQGLKIGSARIMVVAGSKGATIIVAVSPRENLYTLPAGDVQRLGTSGTFYDAWWSSNRPDELPSDYQNFYADLTSQLAWNWRNPNQSFGLSGTPCGIDILAYFVDPANSSRRGWVRTTFGFGGWHYDLNGATNTMTNGVQTNGNVKLELKPEFVYDKTVPYLQITHILTNTGSTKLTNQKFGASADIMIVGNDHAPLKYLQYGALMTNAESGRNPTVKLRLVCQNVQGVDNVTSLWLGSYGGERNYVYEDNRIDINNVDSALNFSFQHIELNPGQSKQFKIRFTQVQ